MSRVATLLYGVVCYYAQLAALLYAVGFLANQWVPRGIDSGQTGPLLPSVLINLCLVALFGLQHTVMARQGFKRLWTRIVPEPAERSTYVLATALALGVLYAFWQPMPGVVWTVDTPWLQTLIWAVYLLGWGITFAATFMINHFDLLGLRQVWRYYKGKPPREAPFRERGLYKHIRNPIMLGLLIAFWATPQMTWGHLLFAAGMTAYIFIGVSFEERDLIRLYGEKYLRFRKQRPLLIPRLKRPAAEETSHHRS